MRWPAFVLGGIAIAVVGIVGWQVWETEQLKIPKWINTDRADCQTWDPYPQRNETVTWTGDCRSGKAEGKGTLTWHYTDPARGELTETTTGTLAGGKLNGQTTMSFSSGNRYEGMVRDGLKNGHGVFTWADGRYEGEYKEDKEHGQGTYTDADGQQYTGQWVEGCLDDDDNIIALSNDYDTCEKLLAK
jgi:hypothetical protein